MEVRRQPDVSDVRAEPALFHTIDGRDVTICHLFVKLGRIEFCGDSPHKLAGQTVPLQPFPGDDE
jgi:hypothetical protein